MEKFKSNPLFGPVLVIIGVLFWPLSDALVKLLYQEQIMLFILWSALLRGIVMYIMGVWLIRRQGRKLSFKEAFAHPEGPLESPEFQAGLMRGLTAVGSTIVILIAIYHLTLQQAMSVVYTSPFIVMLLAPSILGEKFTFTNLIAIAVGFTGMVIVMRPDLGFSGSIIGYAWAFTGALFMAGYVLVCRLYEENDEYLGYCTTGIAYVIIPFLCIIYAYSFERVDSFWIDFSALTWGQIAIFTGAVLTGALGATIGQSGYTYTTAAVGALLSYSELIWISLMDYFMFDEDFEQSTVIGMLIIAGAGMLSIYNDYRITEEENAQKEAEKAKAKKKKKSKTKSSRTKQATGTA